MEGELVPLYPGGAVPAAWKVVADLRVKDPTLTLKQLGASVGYNSGTVWKWTKDPAYQRYENWVLSGQMPSVSREMELARADTVARVKERLGTHAEEMYDRLLFILETSDDAKLQKEIAQDLLDRAGVMSQRQQGPQRSFTIPLTEDTVIMFLTRAREAGLVVEGVVDSAS
jgi:hypothetical protein